MFQTSFAGVSLGEVLSWDEEIPSRVLAEDFPRKHGSFVPPIAFLGTRTIRVNCRAVGASEAALKSFLNDLSYKLYRKGRDKLVLRDDSRYLNAIKTAMRLGYKAGEAPAVQALFSIEFLCDDPFWYSTIESSIATQSIVASPTTFVITHNGPVETPPRIEIKAVGANRTDVKLSNTTVGLFVRYAGTIVAGQTLVIDCAKKTVANAGVNGLNDFTGTFFNLEPGAQNLTFEGAQPCDVTVYWTERWA